MWSIEQKRKYEREYQAKRRNVWFAENGPCKHCGSWRDLELDHINPEDKVTHRIWTWSEERRDIELLKCQVLCKGCHKVKSAFENKKRYPERKHGTIAMYYRGKCRCNLCKEVYSNYRKQLRAGLGE